MNLYGSIRVFTLSIAVVGVLHFVATTFGDGFMIRSEAKSDTTAVASLLQTRAQLAQEIAELRHVVQQLDKVDLMSDLNSPPVLTKAQSHQLPPQPPPHFPPQPPPPPPPPRQQPRQQVEVMTLPLVPPATPPRPSRQESVASAKDSTNIAAALASPGSAAPFVSSSASSAPNFFFSGDALPASLQDFPCALRNFKKAQVTTTCELDCHDAQCARAAEVCRGYVECHYMVVKGNFRRGQDLSRATVVLKKDARRVVDDSIRLLQSSRWWGNQKAFSAESRPRIYVVNSYGGCGSKMLAGWLSQLPAKHKVYVYHIHDRLPPDQLRAMPKPPPPTIRGRGGSDYRTGRFPGGAKFKKDTSLVAANGIDEYRIVYIYKDPVESMVSRYGWGHCNHIQGDCGTIEAKWPRLDAYAGQGTDRMRLNDHFSAYMHPENSGANRNYPVVALNYHRLWDNLPAVMIALGLPTDLASTFPPRTESKSMCYCHCHSLSRRFFFYICRAF